MAAVAVPAQPGEITSAWLNAALRSVGHEVEVDAVAVDQSHEGKAWEGRLALTLDSTARGDVPERLYLKILPPQQNLPRELRWKHMAWREAMFYRDLAGDVPLRVPKPWFTQLDEASGAFVLLLEDLVANGCRLADRAKGVSVARAEAMMADLAELHVRYENAPRRVPSWIPEMSRGTDYAVRLLGYALDNHEDKLTDEFARLARVYIDHQADLHRIWGLGTSPTVIVGDARPANLFVDGDRLGVLDWGLVQTGPPMRDVTYFLTLSLDPGDRAQHEQRLLGLYLDHRADLGGAPMDPDHAWLAYRLHAAYAVTASCQMATFPTGLSEAEQRFGEAFLDRASRAVADLDSYGALCEVSGLGRARRRSRR